MLAFRAAFMVGAAMLAGACAGGSAAPRASADNVALIAVGAIEFDACTGCHSINPDGRSSAGPNLFGVTGRKAGAAPGYPYSRALAEADLTWDAASMDAFLADPDAYLPGSDMRRGQVRDPATREAIIAYLATLDEG